MGFNIKEGHQGGANTLSRLLEVFVEINVKIIGVWGFSEDNWKREKLEIDNLMVVYAKFMLDNIDKLKQNNIKFLCIGKKDRIKKEYPKLFKAIEKITSETSNCNGKTLAFFLDYGERYQLEEFAKERANDKTSTTYELLSKINEGVPLFDMVLRTSGELRFSGFGPLASLAELVVVKKNLPELTDLDVVDALKDFSHRQRRFGGRI